MLRQQYLYHLYFLSFSLCLWPIFAISVHFGSQGLFIATHLWILFWTTSLLATMNNDKLFRDFIYCILFNSCCNKRFCVKSKSNCVLGSVHIERVTLRLRLPVTQFLHSHLAINIATKFATKNEMGLITIFVTKLSEELCVWVCELLVDADAKLLTQCERTRTTADSIKSWFPRGLEKSGNFEQTGKVREFWTDWKSQGILNRLEKSGNFEQTRKSGNFTPKY